MTRHRIAIGILAVLALVLVTQGNVLLLGYTVAAVSLAVVAGLMGWSVLEAIRHSDTVLKRPRSFRRNSDAAAPREPRRAA